MRTYPHCDQRILHRPNACSVCDEYASDLQEVRQAWGIAFTGEEPRKRDGRDVWTDELPCPADANRPNGNYNLWGGNTPKKGRVVGYDAMGYEVTETDPRLERLSRSSAPGVFTRLRRAVRILR